MNKIYFYFRILSIIILFLTISPNLFSQQEINLVEGVLIDYDKCGFFYDDEKNSYTSSINNWGYSYDSLLADLEIWKLSPYVKIDSIGLSVMGRPLWRLTISDDPENILDKRTVHVHARTHPQETEGFWVTDEMIKILLSESPEAQAIRETCVYYIIPMYNPDGVELGYPRENANHVDIESNWNTFPHQPEVAALKASFIELMSSPKPIEVALNIHSSSLCKRYFVYHDSGGTSSTFTLLEQDFIEGIRSYYPSGIEPWYYFISWVNGTPLQYPESWFWINHGENVIALTYEDMNCTSAGNYDLTANALIRGVMDYMGIVTGVNDFAEFVPEKFELYQNYPNPFNPSTVISWQSSIDSWQTLKLYDVLGNEVATLFNEHKPAGVYEIEFNPINLSSGVYFYRLSIGDYFETKKMIYQK
ncbi:MAG: T9SS type A sorting domain-containing protein [Ignavibacteriaceae bacterium]|nr:T9SS type A sorting domain-containing protein [Ignavibacteriaceae bacterium]